MYHQVLDANINRVSEGLRVIEEYTRFVWKEKCLTDELAALRKTINRALPQSPDLLHIRDISSDMRAKEIPSERVGIRDLLIANFKRVQEGLRVLEEYTGNSVFNSARYDAYQLEKRILLPLSKKDIAKGVYLISDSVDVLKKGIEWGVPIIQLRDKYATKKEIYERALELKPFVEGTSTCWIINDFVDICQLVDADGVHTGQDDVDIPHIRRMLGDHKLIGRTTHSLDQGLEAQSQGADYVSIGPLWETPSKPGREAIGFEYLKQAPEHLSVPYVAIGGINRTNIDQVMAHRPFMVGLIRDYEAVPDFMSLFQ